MHKKYQLQTVVLLILASIISACSTSEVSVKEGKESYQRTEKEKLAMNHFLKGNIAENQGRIPEAILEYQDALKYDTSSGIYYSLAKAYFKINKLSNALENIKQAVDMEPKNIDYYHLLGNIFTSAHNIDSAVVVYRKIVSIDSTNTEALFKLGKIYKYDQPLKALEMFEKVLARVGPDWSVLVEIAEINERLGNVDDTINAIEGLLKLNPAELKIQKILIESYMKANRLDDALKLTEQAMYTFPDDLNLIEYKANILLAKGDIESAGSEYQKIVASRQIPFDTKIKIGTMFIGNIEDSTSFKVAKNIFNTIAEDSVNWQVNVYLGEIAAREGNDSLAIEYFDSAAAQARWNSRVWTRLGELLFFAQRSEEIITKLGSVADDFPDDFFINLILGLAYSTDGDNPNAAKYLMKAVELNPNDPTALSSLGFTLNQLKRDEEALVYLNRAKRINPDDIQVWSLLGLIHNGRKEFELSDKAYEKALEIDSTNALVLNNYAYSLAERGLQLNRAKRMSEKALEAEPENSSYLDTYGWVLYRLGEYKEALEYINKAIEKDEDNPILLDHLGDIYFKLNDIEKAIELWNKALEFDKENEQIKEKIKEASL